MSRLPLMCQHTGNFNGPYVPTEGLKGHVHAEGLTDDDVLEICGITYTGVDCYLGSLNKETLAVIFDPNLVQYIKANRQNNSHKPISVWVL